MRDVVAAAAKTAGSFDRTIPIAQTLALVPALRARFGITRIADLRYLDRIGLPVYSSVVPRSRDLLSVYNGKGVTREHALVGAVMEAVERQAAGDVGLPAVMGRATMFDDALDPGDLGADPAWARRDIAFVRGYDVLRERDTYVPRAAVEWPCIGPRIFRVVTTNGLAAGNTRAEAAYHALFELVERHVWSVTHARAYLRPHALLEELAGPGPGRFDRVMTDDPVGTLLELPTGEPAIDAIVERITGCDLTIRLLAIAEGALPLTVFATLAEPFAARPTAHIGIGASWSPVHAVLRALTEAVQSRLTDVQGAREDIARAGDTNAGARFHSHSRRIAELPRGRWHFDGPAAMHAPLASFTDRASGDLGADVRQLLAALRTIGVTRAIIVDISPPGLPVAVVRAIVPELETLVADGRTGRTIRSILDRPA